MSIKRGACTFWDWMYRSASSTLHYGSTISEAAMEADVSLMQALSLAQIEANYLHAIYTGPAAVSGQYARRLDVLVVVFSYGGTEEYEVVIFAPDNAIFLGDGVTLDETNVDVAAWLASYIDAGRSPTDEPLDDIEEGYRAEVRTEMDRLRAAGDLFEKTAQSSRWHTKHGAEVTVSGG